MSHDAPENPKDFEASVAAGYELRDVKLTMIVVTTFACIGLVVAFAAILNHLFVATVDMQQQAALSQPPAQLIEATKEPMQHISTYGVIDQEKGVYRIPVDRAMELLVDEAKSAE